MPLFEFIGQFWAVWSFPQWENNNNFFPFFAKALKEILKTTFSGEKSLCFNYIMSMEGHGKEN